MSDVSAGAAAKAAGLSEKDLTALEASGELTSLPNFSALGGLIGLDGEKLEKIAGGWLPEPKDLGIWRELRCITTTAGAITVNCFLIWDEVSREAALFDTGWDAHPILALLGEN